MSFRILRIKEYNTWTIWNIVNKNEYHKKLVDFLTKDLKLELKRDKLARSNNLLEFGKTFETKTNGKIKTHFKCLFLMTSKPDVKDYIFLNMIRKDPALEEKVDKKLKSISKEKFEKYKKHYYKISLDRSIEINKRSLAESVGLDYDNMQYRVIKMPGTEGGTIIVFKHDIEFLSYPGKKAFEKDKDKILKLLKKNIIKVPK